MASVEAEIELGHSDFDNSLAPEHCHDEVVDADSKEAADFYGALLPGEKVEEDGHEAYLSLPYLRSRVLGQLFFSNYKLIFVVAKTHPSYDQFQMDQESLDLLKTTTPIPYLCILHCKAVDDSAFVQLSNRVTGATGPQLFDVELVSKDVRRLRYHFETLEKRSAFLARLHSFAFFGAAKLTTRSFAPIYHEYLQRTLSMSTTPPCEDIASPAGSDGASSSNSSLSDDTQTSSSWKYSMIQEFERLKTRPSGDKFMIFDQGASYEYFPTYPRYQIVPASVTEQDLREVASYRSSQRIPSIVWLHPKTGASLSRCSQPRSGFTTTSNADQRYVRAIWESNPCYTETPNPDGSVDGLTMLILDARSRTAATANLVVGGGYEGTYGYGRCKIEFAGIANIHAVRESFLALISLCSENKITEQSEVISTQWYQHIETILSASMMMVEAMERGASVLTHCSDGWDRTSQLSSLVQIILDPEFRTARGFCKLIQKEWLSFGHKFCERLGLGEPIIPNSTGASPVFLQFMDCIAQIMMKYPNSFEFTEQFLIRILDIVHNGQYGDFMANCEVAYLSNFANKTRSCWLALETMWRSENGLFKNPNFDANAGPIRLATVISSLSIWEAFFHRYNAQYIESLKQRRLRFYRTHENRLVDSLMGPDANLDQDDGSNMERSLWRSVLYSAARDDLVSSQVKMQIVFLNELFEQGCDECQVKLHFRGEYLQQMVVQQSTAFRVQKLVPSLKAALKEQYAPAASSKHPPDGLVVINATSTTNPDGTRIIHSKVVSSNYKYLYNKVAAFGLWMVRSASAMVDWSSSLLTPTNSARTLESPNSSSASSSSSSPSPQPKSQESALDESQVAAQHEQIPQPAPPTITMEDESSEPVTSEAITNRLDIQTNPESLVAVED